MLRSTIVLENSLCVCYCVGNSQLATPQCYHPCEADMELPPVQIAEIAGNAKFVRVSGE